MNSIIQKLEKSQKFNDYLKDIENKTSPVILSGLTDVTMAQFAVATKEFIKQPICLITYNELQAKKIIEDLKAFDKDVIYFPKKEILTYDYIAESKDLPYERIDALISLKNNKNAILGGINTVSSVSPPTDIAARGVITPIT